MKYRILKTPAGFYIPQRRALFRWVDVENVYYDDSRSRVWECEPRTKWDRAKLDCSQDFERRTGSRQAIVVAEFTLEKATIES